MMRAQRGFTLMEIMIALAVFAIMSAITFGGLNSVLNARATVEARSNELLELQKAFSFMQRDLEQAADRSVRDQFGDPQAPFILDNTGIVFTRGGKANPLNLQRSALERVAYGQTDDKLSLKRWRSLDQPIEPQVDEVALLENIEDLRFRVLDNDKRWQEHWPPAGAQQPGLPRAVEMELEVEGLGKITRIFLLPF